MRRKSSSYRKTYKRRRTNRRSYSRRRLYRRRAIRRGRGVIRQPSFPVANVQLVRSKYYAFGFNQSISNASVVAWNYLGNDIVQPGAPQSDTSSALPYNEWKDFYKNFYVYGSKFTCEIYNSSSPASGTSPRFLVALTANASNVITIASPFAFMLLQNRPKTIIKYCNTPSAGGRVRVSMFQKTSSMFGMKTNGEDNFEGDFNLNLSPADKFYYCINILNPSTGTATYDIRVRVTYYLALRTKKTIYDDD